MAQEMSSTHSDRSDKLESFEQSHGNAVGLELPRSRHTRHGHPLPGHASIQSMLKNSTEIGDVGLFSSRPPRVPPSSSKAFVRALAVPRAVQRVHPQTSSRVYRQQPINDNPGSSEHGSKNNPYLTPSSDQDSPDTHHFESDEGFPLNGRRSGSLTKSSYISHAAMSRQPSGYSTRSQGPSIMYSARPRSPYIYPTRLRRPGYRPSSPAPGDPSRSTLWNASDQRSHYTAIPGPRRETSTGAPTGRKPNAQSQLAPQHDLPPRTADPRNSNTPKPALSLRSIGSSSHLPYVRMIDDASWTNLHCSLSPPVFYDYTEAFEEYAHIRRLSISVAQHTEIEPCDNAPQSVPQIDDSPEVSFIAELPSNAGELQNRNGTNQIECLSCVPSLQGDHSAEPQSSYDENSSESATKASKEDSKEASVTDNILCDLHLEEFLFGADFQQEDEISHSPYSSKHEHGLSKKAGEASDSPTDSSYSADSFTTKDDSEETATPSSVIDTVTQNPRDPLRTPPSTYSPRQAVIELVTEVGPSLSQSADLEWSSHEILAPTPERFIASLTARERLGRILLIDEDSSEVERTPAAHTLSFRRASEEVPSGGVPHEIRHSTPSVAGPRDLITQDSDSEDDYELSEEFREMFCRLRRIKSEEKMSMVVLSTSTPTRQVLTTEDDAHLDSVKLPEKRDLPNIHSSHRKASIIDGLQQSRNGRQTRFSVSESPRVDLDRNKDILAVPQNHRSIKSTTPFDNSLKEGHPFSSSPLENCTGPSESHVQLEAPISADQTKPGSQKQKEVCGPFEVGPNVARISITPHSNLWPRNLEASYPWDDETPAVNVVVPSSRRESSCSNPEHFPRFKLRIQRASSSTGETAERAIRGRSSEDTSSSMLESWTDRTRDLPLRRKLYPDLATHPGQSNSSHDVIPCRPMQTRFVESFQIPSRISPIVTLLPPSPGHEVQSFFSDDSSQVQLKGSLRKRLSHFKTRQARSGLGGDSQGHDRGLLSSAFGISRASGRNSQQSQNMGDGDSQRSRVVLPRWTMLNRVRSWFLRHEDRVREWRWKRQHKINGPRGSEVQTYVGV